MEIYKVFKFDAAHRLPEVGKAHRCAEVHGHSFRVEIYISGPVDSRFGWVMDFAEMDKAFQPVIDQLDHKYLNDIEELMNPTSENIARWIWKRLHVQLPQLSKIVVQESPDTGCIYRGDE